MFMVSACYDDWACCLSAVLLQQVSIGDSDQAWSSLKGCFIFIFYGICELLLQVSEAVIIIRVYSSNGMF
jgi:hypothetical protein